jgi:transcription antitermination factor NusG
MSDRLNEILSEIRTLEKSVKEEIQRKEKEFQYKIRKGRVIFEEEVVQVQRTFSRNLFRYVIGARPLTILSAPVIYAMILPALLLDLCILVYQAICFPIYGIPRVRRSDYIAIDRHYLRYLNALGKLNCDYCGYFNGLAAYVTEIAGRTEQYWCPIKHASGIAGRHSRYHLFIAFGDAETYRTKLAEIRKKYDDLD